MVVTRVTAMIAIADSVLVGLLMQTLLPTVHVMLAMPMLPR
jgi:hypothetical protein